MSLESLLQMVVPAFVMKVIQQLHGAGFQAFLVGGCVRDMQRGLAPKDFDVTTSALPEEVMRLFRKVIPTGIQHGTVTVISSGMHVEVTTFRSEGSYVDGRRPTSVSFHSDVNEDLARRDFTINAMAYNPMSQVLVDPFGGQADLARGVVRAVGNAHARFSEDGLRALRAARFSAVLGFSLESETEAAISQTLDVFRRVSLERVREEFVKLLLAKGAESGLELLGRTGLLQAFLPEVLPDFDALVPVVVRAPARLSVRLAALLHGIEPEEEPCARKAQATLSRLKFPNQVQEDVSNLLRYWRQVERAQSEPEARQVVSVCGREGLTDFFDLLEAIRGQRMERVRALYEQALAGNPALTTKELRLNGAQMMAALQLAPGPKVGEASRFLLQKVLEKPERNTPSELTVLLQEWLKSRG